MKQFIALFFLVTAGWAVRAQSSRDGILYLTRSLSSDAIQQVEASTSGGAIEVSGVAAQDARIEVYVSQNGRTAGLTKEEIQRRLDADYDFSVSVSDHKLTANARTKKGFRDWRKSLNIAFVIYVPSRVSTKLSTSGGGISLQNLSGTQDFSTSGGGLSVKQVSGHITGHTSGGGIEVVDSKEDIDLETSGGGIRASHCSGHIRLNTSGGALLLNDLDGDITATTSGGGIDADQIRGQFSTHTSGGHVTLTGISASLEASTSGGNIRVELVSAAKYVKLRNSGGRIDLQIPRNGGFDLRINADKISTSALSNFNGSSDENEIRGSINGGGIPVIADAGSGRVNLSFR
jgi:hypothetical protein